LRGDISFSTLSGCCFILLADLSALNSLEQSDTLRMRIPMIDMMGTPLNILVVDDELNIRGLYFGIEEMI
jgi:hypothetical protein